MLFFSVAIVNPVRARVALRAKYRVRLAWLIKRLSCRLVSTNIWHILDCEQSFIFLCKVTARETQARER